ncbi:MAG: threonylcarbamoyl-AMP synthase [Treponema sp.]|nr:threonylcarbamoyl-AMP synthase [Treponema sp.]
MICRKSDSESIKNVVEALKKGEVVIIPTDTVYGFSGIADSVHECDKKIRTIKGRSESKPFIQLISCPEKIFDYTDEKIPSTLLEHWPGPLTIIVKDNRYSNVKTAFRCPGDEWLRQILAQVSEPVYSTSLNRSGQPVLDEESAILEEFSNDASVIVLGGDKKNAVPSTIVEFEGENIKVIRQGSVRI